MRSKVKNHRLFKALMSCALAEGFSYSDAVKLVAEKVKYKSHRKVYDLVAKRGGASGEKMIQIASVLNEHVKPAKPYTADHLFGEG